MIELVSMQLCQSCKHSRSVCKISTSAPTCTRKPMLSTSNRIRSVLHLCESCAFNSKCAGWRFDILERLITSSARSQLASHFHSRSLARFYQFVRSSGRHCLQQPLFKSRVPRPMSASLALFILYLCRSEGYFVETSCILLQPGMTHCLHLEDCTP